MTRDAGLDAAGNRAGDALGGRPGRIVAALASVVATVVAGITGLVTRNPVAGFAGALILLAGKVIAFGQTVAGRERGRALTAAETELLTEVYRDSVHLAAIRLVPGRAGVFSRNERPFTLGSTVYLKKDTLPGHVLVHECAHVWQYQHLGPRYAFDALWAQWRVKPDAYAWTDELGRGRRHWHQFNREAQAEFLQDIARHEQAFFTTGERFVLAGTDHTELARETLAQVRAGRLR